MNFYLKNLLNFSLFFVILSVTSCQKDENLPTHNAPNLSTAKIAVNSHNSNESCVTLFGGQTIDVGQVCFSDDGEYLHVTYETSGGWLLTDIHFWIGKSIASLPTNPGGQPVPGHFPYKFEDLDSLTTYSFSISFNDLDFECPGPDQYYVAAKANVVKPDYNGDFDSETAWGDGDKIVNKGNWATYFSIYIDCENGNGGSNGSESAYAYHNSALSTCFNETGVAQNWGWTNGAYGPGVYVLDLWSGAGQCDLSKGTFVGTLTLSYNGSTAVVTYETIGDYGFKEVHLHIGNDSFPIGSNGGYTNAPGQFPYKENSLNGATSHTITINGLSSNIYLIGHAVVHEVQ